MFDSDEIVLCNLFYRNEIIRGSLPEITQQERYLILKNNTIYVDSIYGFGNPKSRSIILHIDFEIDKEYIENLKTLLFGVLNRNKSNKKLYKSISQYPTINISENIVDFKTPITEYNKMYSSYKNLQKELLLKDNEISALKQKLEEKNMEKSVSMFSLDNLNNFIDNSDFIETTWPFVFIDKY